MTSLKKVLIILLPLIALLAAGASLYYRFAGDSQEQITLQDLLPTGMSPDEFSQKLHDNLETIMTETGIDAGNITSDEPDSASADIRMVYTVDVPENISLTLLNVAVNEMCARVGGRVFQGIEAANGRRLTIRVGAGRRPTDLIVLRKMRGLTAKRGTMAIIVDDLGMRTLDIARRLCALEQTLTLSILPFQRNTFDIIQLARKTGTPYMLHLPMEPKSSKVNPGKGAIYATDTREDILEKLDRAFRDVEGAPGVNNHMGSRVTEDLRTMEIVMEYFQQKGVFYVDSQTSRNSVGYSLSQRMGVKSAILTRFIDVKDEQEFIEGRLRELADTAMEKGQVVAICHDRPNTVAVLERILPELEKRGITFIAVETIVR